MAWNLYRLGRWSFRHRFRVIGMWVVLLAVGGAGAVFLSGQTDDSFQLPDTESSQAFDLIKDRTDVQADGAVARLVVTTDGGGALDRAVVEAALKTATTDHVASVADPFTTGTVSEDGTTAYATITYDRTGPELSGADRDALTEAVTQLEDAGLTAAVGGDAAETPALSHTSEIIGIAIALVVLAITFGSLVAAGMPLLTAIVGVGLGILGVTTLTGFMDLSSVTPALASMLGLAVGIDYALFIMSRFKHEVSQGRDLEEAAAVATGTAGSAVVFAGLTVIIALAGLSVCGITFLTQMGLAGAATVAIAVVVALTLLPALLALVGKRITSGHLPGLHDIEPGAHERTAGRRWVRLVTRHRVPTLVLGVAGAIALSIPVASMELALPDDGSRPADSSPRQAFDLIAENFGAGANGPLTVVIDTAQAGDPVAAVDAAVSEIGTIKKDVAAVVPPATDPGDATAVATFQAQLEQVRFATITVVPESGPSAEATKQLVRDIRAGLSDLESATGAVPYVTGQTAAGVDIAQSLSDAFPVYLAVVVGLAFVLLVLVFRSVLVPLKAVIGFLGSVGVSLGATVAVFQWGWLSQLIGIDTESPVMFILPLLLTGILFGLAMDYEVFLVSRMREEFVHGRGARESVVTGFTHSARVVTAAALIMTGVFAGFALADDIIIKTIGFALAVGVIVDAFLIRMTLVPAFMSLVGRPMWWLPRWLDRLLPNVDIEGESLTRELQKAGMAEAPTR
ncbi:MAG: MMPL family transporter [Aeromicrobium sp.]|uniref:MMPL family transporter n=1 Tax=Aeromicrobium sp. TaxID=1871063 RepID=UPI002635A65F|nr:MMPL family transporter [Aeromicrobium sp.]MDF1705091.1 MMPL family transporter [Aeromicrobium sp.]